MFLAALHHKGHVRVWSPRLKRQLMQACLALKPGQGHTASHDPAVPSKHSAWYVHGERLVPHHTLSPYATKM